MRIRRFFWKLFLGNAALLAAALLTSVGLILSEVDRSYLADVRGRLRDMAAGLRAQLPDRRELWDALELQRIVAQAHTAFGKNVRLTIITANGIVLADSHSDPANMDTHTDRPEIRQALAAGEGEATRWSTTLDADLRYVAVRVGPADAPVGVVRTAMEAKHIGLQREATYRLAWTIVVTVVGASALLAMGLAKLWSRRISQITQAARSIIRGDLSARVEVRGSDEVALLARSLNRMRKRITRQLETIERQRRNLDSLVTQLNEGVVVADARGRVRLVNAEARRLLQVSPQVNVNQPNGVAIEQVVPQPELQRLLQPDDGGWTDAAREENQKTMVAGSASMPESPIQLESEDGIVFVLARGSDIAIPDMDSTRGDDFRQLPGRLLVLTDVTEFARTIQIKSDFAANASHELRTPLTAIRAAVETLNSIDPANDRVKFSDFMEMIDRHSQRMEQIVRDLLDLSRVETGAADFTPATLRMPELLEEIRSLYARTLDEKGLVLDTKVDPGSERLVANAQLLRVVLDNLVDNAVRFTKPPGHIRLTAHTVNSSYHVVVDDDGCGIPPEEQERVFERFYQVEQARTGVRRGTGLGLSIVKHAVAALGGSVSLSSQVGRGTTVTVSIPAAPCSPVE